MQRRATFGRGNMVPVLPDMGLFWENVGGLVTFWRRAMCMMTLARGEDGRRGCGRLEMADRQRRSPVDATVSEICGFRCYYWVRIVGL